ncbi:MAG: radical SAM protein [Candidatus Woesearchaeota archaeon]
MVKALNFFDYRILSFFNEANQIRKGEFPLPRFLSFHPNYICNYNCPGCDYRKLNDEYKLNLSREDLNHLLDEFIKIGIKSIDLCGGGEPLLHPNFIEMAEKIHKNNILFGVYTNGSLLNGKRLDVIARYASYVRISLESGTNEVFKKVRNISDDSEFEKVINNIREAIRLRKELNREKELDISLKFTVGKENKDDMENAINLAKELGVDFIAFKMYRNVGVEIKDDQETIDKLALFKEKYGKDVLILGDLKKTKIEGKCWLSPLIPTVDPFGDVYICSYYRHRLDKHRIGNLLKEEFTKLWVSEKHKQLVENIDPDECNVYDCKLHKNNKFMKEVLDEGKLNFI